jgi:hypothetical protein
MKTTHYIEMKVNVPKEALPILHERRVIATADLLDLIASALHRRAAEFRVAGDETPLMVQGEALPMTITHRLGIEVEDPPYTDKRSELIAQAQEEAAKSSAWWTVREGREGEPLSCDCWDGCWRHHSCDWWALLFPTEAQAKEAHRRCYQTEIFGVVREDRLTRGSYVLLGAELRFCCERDLRTLEVWLLTDPQPAPGEGT